MRNGQSKATQKRAPSHPQQLDNMANWKPKYRPGPTTKLYGENVRWKSSWILIFKSVFKNCPLSDRERVREMALEGGWQRKGLDIYRWQPVWTFADQQGPSSEGKRIDFLCHLPLVLLVYPPSSLVMSQKSTQTQKRIQICGSKIVTVS